eukprot:scaffold736_cov254-Pinguiococcus_pyrenoidosus.AAC.29
MRALVLGVVQRFDQRRVVQDPGAAAGVFRCGEESQDVLLDVLQLLPRVAGEPLPLQPFLEQRQVLHLRADLQQLLVQPAGGRREREVDDAQAAHGLGIVAGLGQRRAKEQPERLVERHAGVLGPQAHSVLAVHPANVRMGERRQQRVQALSDAADHHPASEGNAGLQRALEAVLGQRAIGVHVNDLHAVVTRAQLFAAQTGEEAEALTLRVQQQRVARAHDQQHAVLLALRIRRQCRQAPERRRGRRLDSGFREDLAPAPLKLQAHGLRERAQVHEAGGGEQQVSDAGPVLCAQICSCDLPPCPLGLQGREQVLGHADLLLAGGHLGVQPLLVGLGGVVALLESLQTLRQLRQLSALRFQLLLRALQRLSRLQRGLALGLHGGADEVVAVHGLDEEHDDPAGLGGRGHLLRREERVVQVRLHLGHRRGVDVVAREVDHVVQELLGLAQQLLQQRRMVHLSAVGELLQVLAKQDGHALDGEPHRLRRGAQRLHLHQVREVQQL